MCKREASVRLYPTNKKVKKQQTKSWYPTCSATCGDAIHRVIRRKYGRLRDFDNATNNTIFSFDRFRRFYLACSKIAPTHAGLRSTAHNSIVNALQHLHRYRRELIGEMQSVLFKIICYSTNAKQLLGDNDCRTIRNFMELARSFSNTYKEMYAYYVIFY